MAIRNRLFPLVRCCGAGPFWPASFWTTVFKNNVTTPHIPLERIILSISFALTYVSKLTTKNVSRRSCSFLFHLRRSRTFKPALAKKTRFRPAPQHYPKPNLVHFLMRFMKIICHSFFGRKNAFYRETKTWNKNELLHNSFSILIHNNIISHHV